MKTERNILIAFILNLGFSIFEFVGGFITGSVAIASDAVHDLGDAVSIGISYVLERHSKKEPDARHTYGYARYSVIGGVITTVVLLCGSVAVIYGSVTRLFNPVAINYDGMIVLAVVGAVINYIAARVTHHGTSVNQRAVNLHMLEDVLGWIVVLVGAIVMRFTNIAIIDPLMSLGVAIFILVNALRNLMTIVNVFLEKTPDGVDIQQIKEAVQSIKGVEDVHHIHVWSMDGNSNYATMHVVINGNSGGQRIKNAIRRALCETGISHVTLELERTGERCDELVCHPAKAKPTHRH